ncbi:hypothetical protein M3Y94_00829800 [Aphelenchoides besseyi]|nr:hypothetical protein M3Y94_00829800 [Aphelenchoides besseyi]KAI6227029.1 Protoheme IX farnesyltransferase, mitochondrial [Aphelenchoides besseyi]
MLLTRLNCVCVSNSVKRLAYNLAARSVDIQVEQPISYPNDRIRPLELDTRPLPRPLTMNLMIPRTSADDWQKMESKGIRNAYMQLAKHRLTMLVTTTALSGSIMAVAPFNFYAIAGCAVGTCLMSSAANALNQFLEAPYDAQMKRTQSRVLVIHRLSPLNAVSFATVSAIAGTSILYYYCNPLTAALGALNLLLYTGVYTPMKRYHIGCTWAGAVVGAIPPLMGYAALTGSLDVKAMVLAGLLYSWQFPHFNGLSWNLRGDYSRAGYRVMCVTNEGLCRRTTLRHAIALLGLCSVAAPLSELTTLNFAFISLPVNAALLYLSFLFYRNPDAKTSRWLFRFSLLYLPMVMLLMAITKPSISDPTAPSVAKSSA